MIVCFKCENSCEYSEWVEIEPGLAVKLCSACGSKKVKHGTKTTVDLESIPDKQGGQVNSSIVARAL